MYICMQSVLREYCTLCSWYIKLKGQHHRIFLLSSSINPILESWYNGLLHILFPIILNFSKISVMFFAVQVYTTQNWAPHFCPMFWAVMLRVKILARRVELASTLAPFLLWAFGRGDAEIGETCFYIAFNTLPHTSFA